MVSNCSLPICGNMIERGREREFVRVFWPDILQLKTYLFSELSFVNSSVCGFLGICKVANHIVCEYEHLYVFILIRMCLPSFTCLTALVKYSTTKLNWLVESRHPYLIPQRRLLSLSMMFAVHFNKCPLSGWESPLIFLVC